MNLFKIRQCVFSSEKYSKFMYDLATQGLDNSAVTAEAKYPINFTESGKRFLLSLHYNESNSFSFVNAEKMYRFKAKDSEIKPYPLCLGNISKDFTLNI